MELEPVGFTLAASFTFNLNLSLVPVVFILPLLLLMLLLLILLLLLLTAALLSSIGAMALGCFSSLRGLDRLLIWPSSLLAATGGPRLESG